MAIANIDELDPPAVFYEENIDSAVFLYVMYGLPPGGYVERCIRRNYDGAFNSMHPLIKKTKRHNHFTNMLELILTEEMRDLSNWQGILHSSSFGVHGYSEFLNEKYIETQSEDLRLYIISHRFRECITNHAATCAALQSSWHLINKGINARSTRISGIDVRIKEKS